MKKAILITITGRVQGVAFRHYTVVKASDLHIDGYVRNLADGNTVEIFAQGTEEALDQLLNWSQHGPSHAFVEKVSHQWSDAVEGYEGFSVRY